MEDGRSLVGILEGSFRADEDRKGEVERRAEWKGPGGEGVDEGCSPVGRL